MTEAEAKTKWCCGPPMNVHAANIGAGRGDSGPTDGQCVGSSCMAWRWKEVHTPDGWRASKTDGRCGLAGVEAEA